MVELEFRWKYSNWSAVLHNQIVKYNILHFSGWEDVEILNEQFNKLIEGLDMFYSNVNRQGKWDRLKA